MSEILKKVFGQFENKDEFDSLKISIASPEEILSWSHGEVKEPETVNYNSFKPEPDGLFCQKIFGPVKDYECACGKYKRIKYKGTICEKCGVEVGLSSVRRERMGHIKLAVPVSHIWFLKEGVISTLLNIPQKKIEQVIYYDAYIVTEPGLTNLKLYDIITEDVYQNALLEFGEDSFKVEIGAEGVRNILSKLDMADERTKLKQLLDETKSESKYKSILKQLKLVEAFLNSKTNPAWLLPSILPVIPPEMRPMVQLESGSIATSDLNDLYRRVIIRNNRLKKFISMNAPDIIIINEKRMLQEAVDSLFDNGKKVNPMLSQNKRPLKSLSDSLRGKQGRFRINMLGKRTDYSGRSVITVGPSLKLHQVGLPKTMALELFKPFVLAKLLSENHANTLRTARKMIINQEDVVWDVLERVIYQHPVLLNRAPSLHRLSMLAFEPVLVEGNAIKLHPLVCKGFNADFDGDQMAVHVPISIEAQIEARTLMLSTNNILSPANGDPVIGLSQDMVLGIYYMSLINGEHTDKSPYFSSVDEVELALEYKTVELHTPIFARFRGKIYKTTAGRMKLSRILPEGVSFDFINKNMSKNEIDKLIAETYEQAGNKATIILTDTIKNIGFKQATLSGISIGFDDIVIPKEKTKILNETEDIVKEIEEQYNNGLISGDEKHNKLIKLWNNTKETIGDLSYSAIADTKGNNWNSLYMMALSKARGTKGQIQQIGGMRGLVSKPDGEIIEIPITSNFKEGLTMAEYFTSTHGARKGMSDTSLKTANAGYLTRRLVSLSHNVVITENDCKTKDFITVKPVYEGSAISIKLGDRVLGRTVAQDVFDPKTNELIVKKGELITKLIAKKINETDLLSINVRSVTTCCSNGLCAKCYGMDLSSGKLVNIGEAVGVIAAQSVGQPGTQLTLRTFHSGGIASSSMENHFIETPFEGNVRFDGVNTIVNSKNKKIIVSRSAKFTILNDKKEELLSKKLPYGSVLLVNDGDLVEKGAKIAENDPYSNIIIAEKDGIVQFNDLIENISYSETVNESTGIISRTIINWKTLTTKSLKPSITLVDKNGEKLAEYILPKTSILNVEDKNVVKAGDILAKIPLQTQKSLDITGGLPRVEELFELRNPINPATLAEFDGVVELDDSKTKTIIRIKDEKNNKEIEFSVPKGSYILVNDGDVVKKADKIVDGSIVPQDILRILGEKEFMTYMLDQVQDVYRKQGEIINDKHMEILIREMIRKKEIVDSGDTSFNVGQIVDKNDFIEENEEVKKNGGNPAKASNVAVGLTKASLTSRSFMSNASFQQTTKVLVSAAVKGAKDKLLGVNENLIVGRLVPIGTGAYIRKIHDLSNKMNEEEKKDETQQFLKI